MTTREKIIAIAKDEAGIPLDREIDTSLCFSDSLGMDSLDVVGFTIQIESEFNLEIGDEDFEKFRSVDDVITYVEGRV